MYINSDWLDLNEMFKSRGQSLVNKMNKIKKSQIFVDYCYDCARTWPTIVLVLARTSHSTRQKIYTQCFSDIYISDVAENIGPYS